MSCFCTARACNDFDQVCHRASSKCVRAGGDDEPRMRPSRSYLWQSNINRPPSKRSWSWLRCANVLIPCLRRGALVKTRQSTSGDILQQEDAGCFKMPLYMNGARSSTAVCLEAEPTARSGRASIAYFGGHLRWLSQFLLPKCARRPCTHSHSTSTTSSLGIKQCRA